MKRCKKCGETKPFDQFHAATGMRDGYRNECKACYRARQRAYYVANRERIIARVTAWQRRNRDRHLAWQREYKRSRPGLERDGHLRRKFGITQADYLAMLEAQGGRCAICRRPPSPERSLHVDHDHETGEVRGLLCFTCNNGLGQFREDPALFHSAAEYLVGNTAAADVDLVSGLALERVRLLRAA